MAVEPHALYPTQPEWGSSPYYTLHLRHDGLRLQDVLTHLYVLLPVLDNDKHYYVNQNEAGKLLHRGGEWLPSHPERGFITRRYLRHRALCVNPLLARLLEGTEEELSDEEASAAESASPPGPRSEKGEGSLMVCFGC